MSDGPIVRALHHVALRTADADEAAERWKDLWSLRDAPGEPGVRRLRCAGEAYGIELIGASDAGHDHTAFELQQQLTLQDAAARLDALGIAYARARDALRFSDPEGYGIELLPYVEPGDRRPYVARTGGDALAGAPRRVGHANMLVSDARALAAFYEDALGLRVSDWIGDGAVWLRSGALHHEIAMLEKSPTHFHHVAFELVDFAQMRETLDHVAQRGRWVAWGPGRHAMAQNLFSYVRMPEEDCFVELYCDMEILPDDHTPRAWPDDVHSSNAWGTLPPRTYFRFDPESVRVEREQLIQLGLEFIPA
jgi:catechol 2,3-dioxygenase-like lactoylglutathione lyase family enzyme